MASNPFLDLRVRAGDVQRSVNWYQSQIRSLQNMQGGVTRMLTSDSAHLTSNYQPGRLYLFRYDAKHKDTLPYWDALPLVFPFRKVKGGFYGINLHYLPYGLRFALMGNLLELAQGNENRRLMLSWQLLNQSSKFNGVSACVKHYLHDHVHSNFLNIPPDQWLAASMLPIEQFQNSSKDAVFKASRKKI